MIYKGRVIDLEDNYALVVTNEMNYINVIKKEGMYTGMKIIFTENDVYKEKKNFYRNVLAYAALILLIICSAGLFTRFTPYFENNTVAAIVSIDINPSLELELNKKNEVINLIPINKDAIKMSEQDLNGRNVSDALLILISEAKKQKYMETGDSFILLSSVIIEKEYVFDLSNLTATIKKRLTTNEDFKDIVVYSIESEIDNLKISRELGLSIGKYQMYKKFDEENEGISLEEVKDMKIGELLNRERIRNSSRNTNTEEHRYRYVDDYEIEKEKLIQERNKFRFNNINKGINTDSNKGNRNSGEKNSKSPNNPDEGHKEEHDQDTNGQRWNMNYIETETETNDNNTSIIEENTKGHQESRDKEENGTKVQIGSGKSEMGNDKPSKNGNSNK